MQHISLVLLNMLYMFIWTCGFWFIFLHWTRHFSTPINAFWCAFQCFIFIICCYFKYICFTDESTVIVTSMLLMTHVMYIAIIVTRFLNSMCICICAPCWRTKIQQTFIGKKNIGNCRPLSRSHQLLKTEANVLGKVLWVLCPPHTPLGSRYTKDRGVPNIMRSGVVLVVAFTSESGSVQ